MASSSGIVPFNYTTEVQALCCLLRIRGDYARELVEILEIIDTNYKQEVDIKTFSTCYFGDCSKFFRFLYGIYVDTVGIELLKVSPPPMPSFSGGASGRVGTAQSSSSGRGGTADPTATTGGNIQQRIMKQSSYFTLLSFILFMNSLKKHEYLPFLLWFCIGQFEDKVLDKFELGNLIEKITTTFVPQFEDKKVQSRFAKNFFQFKKRLDEEVSDGGGGGAPNAGELKMDDLNSIELRSGQPLTSLMYQMIFIFRDFTLGPSRWKEIANETSLSMKNLKLHYEYMERSHHCEPNFEEGLFVTRKVSRKRIRLFVRFLQKYKVYLAMTDLNDNMLEDDAWYISVMKMMGLVKGLDRLQQDRNDDLDGKHPHLRVTYTMEGARYIEEAKVKTNEEVIEAAHEVCGQVWEIANLCRDALNSQVGSRLSSVSFKG